MAYVQYLNAYGEWQVTERMSLDEAEATAASMLDIQKAFVRRCGPF